MSTSAYRPGLLPAILAGVLVFVVIATILGASSFIDLRQRQEEFANEIFNVLADLDQEILDILVPLNALGFDECSEQNLRAMEAVLFESTFSKHIMFYVDDAGVCSTGSGILDSPVRRPPPDFVGPGGLQLEIWVNREMILDLTGKPYTAIILKKDNYSIMLDPANLIPIISTPFDWAFVFRDPGSNSQTYILGNQELAATTPESRDGYWFEFDSCSPEFPYYCAIVASPDSSFLDENSGSIFLMLTFSLALGYITSLRTHKRMLDRVQIPARVEKGFSTNAYYWLYQPIVDLESSNIIGCEVLARFRDRFGELSPFNFLPAIREAGRTAEFTKRMLITVLRELEPHTELPDGFKVGFNIFPYDVVTSDIHDIIDQPEIRNSRFRITLEITEDEHLDEKVAIENLKKVHDSNLLISIDDFGTGYSNLKQIRKLNSSYLKIDRSYVMELENTPIRASLIPHIVNMAEQLDLEVVAEGIETPQQKLILRELKVKYGQGWLFGKPMSAQDLAAKIVADCQNQEHAEA